MKRRLFFNTLIITAVVLTVFGLLVAVGAGFWYSHLMVDELKKDTAVIDDQLPGTADMHAFARSLASQLSFGGNDIRVTVVAQDGRVLGDSSADEQTMQNHATRPEILQAKKEGWGWAKRYSATLHVSMLYVALYDAGRQQYVRASMPMVEIRRIYWAFGGFTLAGLLISLGVATLMARRTSGLLSRPVEDLARMTREIASGNYGVSAPAGRFPEFLELSNGLAELAKDLDAHVSALENSNTQLTTVLSSINEGLIALDGEERLLFINNVACTMLEMGNPEALIGKRASVALASRPVLDLAEECLKEKRTLNAEVTLPSGNLLMQASASPMLAPASGCILLLVDITQLRKLENMRRDFVANVTHELRTPLTSIRGYVETLQNGALENPELSTKFLQIIEIESERLSNLINDLLYLSEIESANQDTGIRRFRLEHIAESVAEMLGMAAAARKVAINCSIGEDLWLEANPDRIKQLLLNLADNAVKYNQEGGSVTISAERTHSLARIRVKDTGIGISEEHISRIFERFYRVDKGRSRSQGGTGLGLSIVKHIVDLYRGNIRLISEIGKGSEFIIELPLKYETKKKNT